jgi:hypothetical protein
MNMCIDERRSLTPSKKAWLQQSSSWGVGLVWGGRGSGVVVAGMVVGSGVVVVGWGVLGSAVVVAGMVVGSAVVVAGMVVVGTGVVVEHSKGHAETSIVASDIS